MTSQTESNRKTRRDAWLTIALAVAQGMPEPCELTVGGPIDSIDITPHNLTDFHRWAEHVNARTDQPFTTEAGRTIYSSFAKNWHGWRTMIRYYADSTPSPSTSDLAEQVAAAIVTPDSTEVADPDALAMLRAFALAEVSS